MGRLRRVACHRISPKALFNFKINSTITIHSLTITKGLPFLPYMYYNIHIYSTNTETTEATFTCKANTYMYTVQSCELYILNIQCVQNDAETPYVTHLGILVPGVEHLRSHVVESAALAMHEVVTAWQALHVGQAKVCHLRI